VKIVSNALSDDLLSRCIEEFKEKIKIPCWGSSSLLWQLKSQEGISGSTLCTYTSEEIGDDIAKQVLPHLPNEYKFDKITTKYHLWQPHSGVSIHNDESYNFGATIYLNEEWDGNSGGWFIWRDKDTDEWKVLLPTINTMVMNIDCEQHLVTPVSPNKFRLTIQIFGDWRDDKGKE
tara:strand:- start:202 stop:729 length:528 start_codon:yes stop_codon:yes gene_type:complete